MGSENMGLIFVEGKMLSATEAAAYIKELKRENEKLKEENLWLKEGNYSLSRQIWPRRADPHSLSFCKAFCERFETGLLLEENYKLKTENEHLKKVIDGKK